MSADRPQTTNQTQHPQSETVGHDLDPNEDGDLVVHVKVAVSQALVIAVNSTSSQNVSVSVRWIDGESSDNEFVSESATDINMSGVQNDHARLFRKGLIAEVTFTSDAGAGTTNNINAFVDAHR